MKKWQLVSQLVQSGGFIFVAAVEVDCYYYFILFL